MKNAIKRTKAGVCSFHLKRHVKQWKIKKKVQKNFWHLDQNHELQRDIGKIILFGVLIYYIFYIQDNWLRNVIQLMCLCPHLPHVWHVHTNCSLNVLCVCIKEDQCSQLISYLRIIHCQTMFTTTNLFPHFKGLDMFLVTNSARLKLICNFRVFYWGWRKKSVICCTMWKFD